MAGLVPATHAPSEKHRKAGVEKGGWVYFLSNHPNGTLYVGVTSDLVRRIGEHKEGKIHGFTRRYYLKRLVHYEFHNEITAAIQRESNIKHWPRQWKIKGQSRLARSLRSGHWLGMKRNEGSFAGARVAGTSPAMTVIFGLPPA